MFLGTPQRFVSTVGWNETADKLADVIATTTTITPVSNAFSSDFYQLAKLENDFNSGMVENMAIFSFYEGVKTALPAGQLDYVHPTSLHHRFQIYDI